MRFIKWFLAPEGFFFLLVSVGFMAAFRERAFADPGSLWHIRVGEIILDHGFPRTDPFTYTHEGVKWIPQQWGAEIVMAKAYRWAGFDALLSLLCISIAAAFTYLFARVRQAGTHSAFAAVIVAAFLFVGSFHFFVRPHMVTIFFTMFTAILLADCDRGTISIRRLGWLIPLNLVWTNLHGGVLGGLMMLGFCLFGWTLAYLFRRPSPLKSRRDVQVSILICVAAGLTIFVNPFGLEMIETWFRIVGSPVLKAQVAEHQPLHQAGTSGFVVLGGAALYLLFLIGTLPRWPRTTWFLPLIWFAFSFAGIRQGPLFAVTALVMVADFFSETFWHRLLKKHGDSLIVTPPTVNGLFWLRAALLPLSFVGLCATLLTTGTAVPVIGSGWARIHEQSAPHGLTERLREYARARGPNARILNDANYGGYLIFYVPELKIFMDDRFELYGDEWTDKYVKAAKEDPEQFEAWADKYQTDWMLVQLDPEKRLLVESYLDEHPTLWTKVAETKWAAIYERKR